MFGFSKKNLEVAQMNVLFHEDHEPKEISEEIVGRKGRSLFNLRGMDVPIPDFFVISPKVFKEFIVNSFDEKLKSLLDKGREPDVKELEKIIMSSNFSDEVREDILRCYSRLSGFSNAWVAVRSSVVYTADPAVTFSGLFHTELSVRGIDQLFEAVKYVYLSVFKDKVILYAREKAIDLSDLQMAIVVQRMVQPEVSGIAYTVDPITGDNKRMSVEAVFGLGDVIADGLITPDQYVLEKKNLDVTEKKISPQEWMRIRKPGESKIGDPAAFQKIQISNAWSHQQKIEDKYLQDISKVALIIETKSKTAQLIEWSWESGNVWVLQNKDLFAQKAKPAEKKEVKKEYRSVFDLALEMIKQQRDEEEEKDEAIEEQKLEVVKDEQKTEDVKEEKPVEEAKEEEKVKVEKKDVLRLREKIAKLTMKKEKKEEADKTKKMKEQKKERKELGLPQEKIPEKAEFLLSGIGTSNGIATGQLLMVDHKTDRNTPVTKDTILLIREYDATVEKLVMASGGIIMDGGGLTSDVSILCREVGIPAVVGTGLASSLLKEKEFVKIDGNVGSIYRFVKEKIQEAVKVEQKAELMKDDEKVKKIEEIKEIKEKEQKEAKQKEKTKVIKKKKSKKARSPVKAPIETAEKYMTATKLFLMPEAEKRASDYEKYMPNSNGYCYIDLEQLMSEFGRHPLAHVEEKTYKGFAKQIEVIVDEFSDMTDGDEVIVSIGSRTVKELRSLTKGKSYEDKDLSGELFGAQRLLKEKDLLEKEVSLVKKLRNTYQSRNVTLAVHSPANADVMKEIKKEISSIGLQRTGTFKLYAIIETPAEVILAEDIAQSGIDGVIINTVSLAMQMQGLSRSMTNPKYDIGTNSLWKIISEVINKVKATKTEVLVVAEDNAALLQNCVNAGVYGIAVTPKETNKLKKAISEEEAKMILSIED